MIELRDIHFTYNENTVFSGLNLHVKENERLVIVGVNGSGKSTLLKIMDGLIFPQKGTYTFKGFQITKDSLKKKNFQRTFRRSVVLLFQNPDTMLFNPTVYDEIAFGLKQLNIDSIDERVKYWAEKCNVSHLLDNPPFNLSGGEKKKVCLASILAVEPDLLLLDEPTSNLDPPTVGWLVELLDELNVTTVVTTHNLSLAPELGQRCIVLTKDGTIIDDGNIEDILNDKELLMKANLIHTHKHRHGTLIHTHFHIHDWD